MTRQSHRLFNKVKRGVLQTNLGNADDDGGGGGDVKDTKVSSETINDQCTTLPASKRRASMGKKKLPVGPLVGREEEFADIHRPLLSALHSSLGCYVSGVPGTGKTATVRAVLKSILQSPDTSFDWVEINGMKVASPHDIYTILYKQLSGKKAAPQTAAKRLDSYFKADNIRPCVLVIDEVDSLLSKNFSNQRSKRYQSILYRLLEWPGQAPLSIIAIANTMDLPERQLGGRLSSRLGMLRVNFAPYSYPQLIRIINDRINATGNGDGNRALSADAVEYLARKVGAVSGDARRAIGLAIKALSSNVNAKVLSIKDVDAMLQATTNQTTHILASLNICCKLVLVSVYLLFKQGVSTLTIDQVLSNGWQLARTLGIMEVGSYHSILKAIHCLLSMGILSKRSAGHVVSLSAIHDADILAAYKSDPLFSKFFSVELIIHQ